MYIAHWLVAAAAAAAAAKQPPWPFVLLFVWLLLTHAALAASTLLYSTLLYPPVFLADFFFSRLIMLLVFLPGLPPCPGGVPASGGRLYMGRNADGEAEAPGDLPGVAGEVSRVLPGRAYKRWVGLGYVLNICEVTSTRRAIIRWDLVWFHEPPPPPHQRLLTGVWCWSFGRVAVLFCCLVFGTYQYVHVCGPGFVCRPIR